MRSNYLVLKLSNKISQQRTTILFEEYPDIPITYDLYHTMQMIFSKDTFNELKHTKWRCVVMHDAPSFLFNTIHIG